MNHQSARTVFLAATAMAGNRARTMRHPQMRCRAESGSEQHRGTEDMNPLEEQIAVHAGLPLIPNGDQDECREHYDRRLGQPA